MSLISNQVEILREKADMFRRYKCTHLNIIEYLEQAADTIEALSAKLAAANMERSERYYKVIEIISTLVATLDNANNDAVNASTKDGIRYYEGKQDGIQIAIARIKSLLESTERHYGGGWIPCSYKLPTEKGKYWITYFWGDEERVDISEFENGKFAFAVSTKTDVIAWRPCVFPEPYNPKE